MNRRSFLGDLLAAAALARGAPLMRRCPRVPIPFEVADYNLGRGVLYLSPIDGDGKPTGAWEPIGSVEGFSVQVADQLR